MADFEEIIGAPIMRDGVRIILRNSRVEIEIKIMLVSTVVSGFGFRSLSVELMFEGIYA